MTHTTDPQTQESRSTEPGGAALRMSAITKRYTGVVAARQVDFECYPGEVHALVGENGSGKSTVIKVAAGLLTPDEGTIEIDGKRLTKADPRQARRLGLMTAYQDTSLIGDLTVAENIALSFHCQGEDAPRDLRAVITRYGLPFGPRDLVKSLGPGGRQLLEVVRAIIHRPKVLLVDEPTAVLDLNSADHLQDLIEDVRDEGCAVVYVSHRLEEVKRLADRLTVIRDGVVQGTHLRAGWNVDQIVELMVGTAVDLEFPDRVPPTAPAPLLKVDELCAAGIGPVSIEVGAGEIVGVAGAEGNGQRQLLRAMIGVGRTAGTVQLRDESVPNSPGGALRAGISFQSGDRVAESVFPSMSTVANATMQLGGELGPAGTIQRGGMVRRFRSAVDQLGIVIASADQPIGALSGGNQQKVVLSRALLRRPDLLIVDEPTQGVDAKARLDIYRLLVDTAESGVGVLVNSSDSSELAGLCDRVYVMSEGVVIDQIEGEFGESDIVRRFVSATGKRDPDESAGTAGRRRISEALASPWVPVAVLALLTVLLGGYTASRSPGFLESFNLNNLMLSALPLLWVALGQQFALLVAELDISVGASMTMSVVITSFLMTTYAVGSILAGVAVIVLVAVGVGLFNSFLTQALGVTPLVATIGTLGIVSGLCILLRPQPGGAIAFELSLKLSQGLGFVPIGVIAAVVVAILLDLWLFRTGAGLSARAVGFKNEASQRIGVRVRRVKVAAYLAAALGAAVGGVFLAAQVGVGSNNVGLPLALPAFAACFLGGATLLGGRGTFVGALLGGLFLTLISNAAQALAITFAWTQVIYGAILLVAVALYSISARRTQS